MPNVGLHVVLVAPEIAPNTGNIIRLCANTGAKLHLVEPLGFALDDRSLRRAGLDYHELADVRVHRDLASCLSALDALAVPPDRRFALTGRATRRYDQVDFQPDDVIVFGAERGGLDESVLDRFGEEQRLSIPMRAGSRSLNLANAVAVVVYEAWRQLAFEQAAGAAILGETPASGPF